MDARWEEGQKKKHDPDGRNWMQRQKTMKTMKRVEESFDLLQDQRLSRERDEKERSLDWKSLSDKRWKEIV